MDFLIPEIMLKQDKWNFIQIGYTRGNNCFGIKVNKSYYDEYTKLPIRNLDKETEFNIILDTRQVVKK